MSGVPSSSTLSVNPTLGMPNALTPTMTSTPGIPSDIPASATKSGPTESTERGIYFTEGDIPYGVFSNRAPYNVYISGKEYATVEHYFQSQKFAGSGYAEKIRTAATPALAVQFALSGERDLIRPDWTTAREEVLERAVYVKFTQHPELKDILLSTGQAKIFQKVKDPEDIGPNGLGTVLQKVRQQLVFQAVGAIRQYLIRQPALQIPACPRGLNCRQMDDERHKAEFCHPCPRGALCVNASTWHLQQFLHGDEILTKGQGANAAAALQMPAAENCLKPSIVNLTMNKSLMTSSSQLPVCAFLFECKLLQCPGHEDKFAHFCDEGFQCPDFSIDHRTKWMHADDQPTPCPAGLRCGQTENISHLLKHSHPCSQGLKCTLMSNAHIEFFTHEAPVCPYGLHCWRKKFKDHVVQYTHPCQKGLGCRKMDNLLHCRMYTHEELDQFGRPTGGYSAAAGPPPSARNMAGLPAI